MGRLAGTTTASENTYYHYDEVGNRKWLSIDTTGDFVYEPINPTGYEIKTDYTYDNCNRLTDLIQQKAGPSQLAAYNYTVKANGHRHSLNESLNEARDITYSYDNLNRLTGENASSGSYSYTATYEYDLAGNRLYRQINANGQYLTTEYDYYTGTDKLYRERHCGASCAMIIGDEKYYAYTGTDGGYYYRDSQGNKVSSLKAFFIGLPSGISRWLFGLAMAMLIVALFIPALVQILIRLAGREPVRMPLGLRHRCLSVLLAYVMLISPAGFQQMADASVQYSQLGASTWGQADRTIEYTYDDNGSVQTKTTSVTSTQTVTETVTNTYNLQNRLKRVETDYQNDTVEIAEYKYNPDGVRVSKHTRTEISGTPQNDDITVVYLVDSYNHTGYAQVLEEKTYNGTDTSGEPDSLTTYLIGDDVIAQTVDGTTKYLLYDGHGSTRQLAEYDTSVTIADDFSYDGYGVLLQDESAAQYDPGYTSQQATNLLYAGEQWDASAQQYYLRARYYNPLNGLFNRIDPFAGNSQDPQSLHKYLYAHSSPVMNVDPSGELIGGVTGLINAVAIRIMLFGMKYGPTIAAGTFAVTKITAAMLLSTITYMALDELGVVPHSELVAEIGAILGYALIAEMFIIAMLPPSWVAPPQAQGRGMNNAAIRKAVNTGLRVHYDKTTDITRYSHEGGPTQLQQRYPNTAFDFARRGQAGVDVKVAGNPHPSTYPGSTWPSNIMKADFKPDTPTGNAFKLPPCTLRITYDPETGMINAP